MTQLLLAAVACALAAPPVAQAPAAPEAAPTPSLSIGVGAGFAFGLGNRESGVAMKDTVARAVPVQLWAGWAVTPELELGLQGGWGYGFLGDARDTLCKDASVDCSAHLWRLAARGEYAWRGGRWVPWGAAALGWEWNVERWEESGSNWEKRSASGWLLGLEAGIDRQVSRVLELGIFAGVTLGQYRRASVSGETVGYAYSDVQPVESPAIHAWLSVGLRGVFGFLQ